MKRFIKASLRNFGLEIKKRGSTTLFKKVSLKPNSAPRGNVLLALWIKPFLLKKDEPVPNNHAHHWRSLQIALTFLQLGYNVDVIDYLNEEFVPKKRYNFFLSFRTHFDKIAHRLNENCVKIAYLDTAHWLFNNSAAFRRGLDLQRRKGVSLGGLRVLECDRAFETADCALMAGNQFTLDTYNYLKKPIYHLAYPACGSYAIPEAKDFDACRKSFLWFGSSGFVHKGLDLVLDAFAEMPDHELYVCGPIHAEKDFEQAFRKELYESANIHTLGWMDVDSPEFKRITNKCVGLVYPSCSEGGGGSVLTCMHDGLIPIVSYESSVDVEDFGILLKDSSISEIKNSVRLLSALPNERLKTMWLKTWSFAQANHTREKFNEQLRNILVHLTGASYITSDGPGRGSPPPGDQDDQHPLDPRTATAA